MATTTERLQIIIEALNMSKDEMKRLQKDLEGTDAKSKEAKSSMGGMQNSLRTLAVVAGTATAAFYTLKKAFDFAKEGAAIERLEKSGVRLAETHGQSMDRIVRSIQDASDHTISRTSAMRSANQAMLLDVAKSPEEFDKLTKAAVALGRAMGRTAEQSIQDVTVGIGRQSKKILDNLGVVEDMGQVYADYAEELDKSAESLTDAEKKQALLNVTLKAAKPLLDENGEIIGDNAAEMEKLNAHWEDYTANLKKGVLRAIIPTIKEQNKATEATQLFTEALEQNILTQIEERRVRALLKYGETEEALRILEQRHDDLTDASTRTNQTLDTERGKLYGLEQAAGDAGDTIQKLSEKELDEILGQVEGMNTEFQKLLDKMTPVSGDEAQALRDIDRERRAIEGRRDPWIRDGEGGGAAEVTVEAGDTLSELAVDLGTSVNALMELNPEIENPNLIHVGQTIKTGIVEAADAVSGGADSLDSRLQNLTGRPHTLDVKLNILPPDKRTPFTQWIREEIRENLQ